MAFAIVTLLAVTAIFATEVAFLAR